MAWVLPFPAQASRKWEPGGWESRNISYVMYGPLCWQPRASGPSLVSLKLSFCLRLGKNLAEVKGASLNVAGAMPDGGWNRLPHQRRREVGTEAVCGLESSNHRPICYPGVVTQGLDSCDGLFGVCFVHGVGFWTQVAGLYPVLRSLQALPTARLDSAYPPWAKPHMWPSAPLCSSAICVSRAGFSPPMPVSAPRSKHGSGHG